MDILEYKKCKRWHQTTDVELFWDSQNRRLIFKKLKFLGSTVLDTGQQNPYIDLQGYGTKYLAAV
jgi:hypothetical protein